MLNMYQESIDKRVIRTRHTLFEALQKLLRVKPINDITISEVVSIAGIGRASFYRHFNKLDDILKWRIQQEFRILQKGFRSQPNATFHQFLEFFFSFWVRKKDVLITLIQAHRMDIFEEFLEQQLGYDKQELSPATHPFPEIWKTGCHTGYICTIIKGIISSTLVRWAQDGYHENAAQLTQYVTSTIQMLSKRLISA